MFTALLIGALATLRLPTVTAWAFLAGVWIVAVVATLLIYRLTGFKSKSKDWPRVSFAALLIVTTLLGGSSNLLAQVVGVRATNVVGAAILGGFTFGSATAVGVLAASFLAKRRARTSSGEQSPLP
jgi:hypothetical protein